VANVDTDRQRIVHRDSPGGVGGKVCCHRLPCSWIEGIRCFLGPSGVPLATPITSEQLLTPMCTCKMAVKPVCVCVCDVGTDLIAWMVRSLDVDDTGE